MLSLQKGHRQRVLQNRILVQRIEPKTGQESVWDYPRPPRVEASSRLVRVQWRGVTVAETRRAFRVLETSHPPNWYIPRVDVSTEYITRVAGSSMCEWKGAATYWSLRDGSASAERAAWSYEAPTPAFEVIAGYLAFYPVLAECFVDGERAEAQPGSFYGGWVTGDVVGPFKGAPGSFGW